jgi:hypothetical protein
MSPVVGFDSAFHCCSKMGMTKALSLIFLAIMAIQIIKPLGLPGLRQRRDIWKLALIAMAAIGVTVVASHIG